MKPFYFLKRQGAPVCEAFISTCRYETALFQALGYSVRKVFVASLGK